MTEEVERFHKGLDILDYKFKPIWGNYNEEGNSDNGDGNDDEQKTKVKSGRDYKYQSLWAIPQVKPENVEQLKAYKYSTPFASELSDSKSTFSEPGSKKKISTVQSTIPPWKQCLLPAPTLPKPRFQQPKTSLWDTSASEKQQSVEQANGDPILCSLRQQLKARGASGILGLARKFRVMDDDQNGSLDQIEFEKAMKECDIIDLSKKAISHLFRYFDTDDSGTISYDEFLVGVRGELNERRRKLVQMAFKQIDTDGSGILTLDDIRNVYDTSQHPEVIRGKKTNDEVLTEFLLNFQGNVNAIKKPNSKKESEVTPIEFERYYSNLSASIDDDDYFELMIRNAWGISGGEGWCANTSNRRTLVTDAVTGIETVKEVKQLKDSRKKKN